MITLGASLFAAAALLLSFMAFNALQQQRASFIAFAALAGYAIVSVLTADSLVNQFDGETYLAGALIYTVGSVSLSLSSGLFALVAGVGRLDMPEWDQRDFSRHANVALVLGLASLVLLGASREDLLVSWSEARLGSGLTTVLATFLLLLACPGVATAWVAKRPAMAVALFALCGTSFMLLGSRAALLCALVLALWLMLTRARGTTSKLRILLFAALAGFAAHVLLRQVRGLGVGGLLQAIEDDNLLAVLFSSDVNADLSGGEAAIPKYFLFATSVSSVSDFGFMSSMQRLALMPIPRIEGWIDKPVDVTYLLWEKAYQAGLFANSEGQEILLDSYLSGSLGSLHPTLFGEYFLAGGWISLLLSTALLGAVLSLIDFAMRRMNRLTSLALCGPLLVGYLFVARGNSVIGLGYFFYLGILFGLGRFAVSRILRSRFMRLLKRARARSHLSTRHAVIQ